MFVLKMSKADYVPDGGVVYNGHVWFVGDDEQALVDLGMGMYSPESSQDEYLGVERLFDSTALKRYWPCWAGGFVDDSFGVVYEIE